MAVTDQLITDRFAIYCGDCMSVLPKLPDAKVHLSVYSPPFAGLYNYSSTPEDFSNCQSYDDFMAQYAFLVVELARVTMPGRITAVHCMDVPSGNTGRDHMIDFPGDIIRLHERHGWKYVGRYTIWKDPFQVYLRTLQKSLRHRTCADDSTKTSAAASDYILTFRRDGENPIPVSHPTGLMTYAGDTPVPADLLKFRGWTGKQTENKYSQWVWRQYASAIWNDVRLDRVLPYRDAKEPDDERHVHPLQLDVIERAITLWSNPGETVFTPFMGVGSEVWGAVTLGRRGIGVELKPSYYKQAVLNVKAAADGRPITEEKTQVEMFAESDMGSDEADQ